MPEPMSVPSERVVEILTRDPLGAALWRAAANEALVEIYAQRIEQLEKQKSPAAVPPSSE